MEVLSVSVNTGQLETRPQRHGMDNRDSHHLSASSLRLTTGSRVPQEPKIGPAWFRRLWVPPLLVGDWHRAEWERPERSELDD